MSAGTSHDETFQNYETIPIGPINTHLVNHVTGPEENRTVLDAEDRLGSLERGTEAVAEQRVVLNVSGIKFETYRSTLERDVQCNLAKSEFREGFYNEEDGEYFFDRDPDVFKAVLNYLRTGELHLPSYICGPAAKLEIRFWGLATNKIQRCCWIQYNEWNSTQEALIRLEHDRKINLVPDNGTDLTCWQKWKPYVWKRLNHSNTTGAKIVGIISLSFVVLSIFSFLAETTHYFQPVLSTSSETSTSATPSNATNTSNTVITTTTASADDSESKKSPLLFIIDVICLTYFCIEYIVRMIFAPNKCKYAKSIMSVVDLIAIIPDFVEIIIYALRPDLKQDVDAVSYITLLRVLRVLRIFRLVRHSAGLWILIYTLRASFNELILLFWFMSLGVLVFSSLIYYVEDRDRFRSIPDGFWWSLITMTTVGYGDMYPVTIMGKIVGALCAMSGVLMIGFTVPALVNNFMLYYRHIQFAMHMEKLEEEAEDITALSRRGSKSSKSNIPTVETCSSDFGVINNNKVEEGLIYNDRNFAEVRL